ncbi:MAG: hypothetical protein CMF69_07395 [Magnetovibrio sp.]|nr:hypothetical protein [Magnetovibrio sp.]
MTKNKKPLWDSQKQKDYWLEKKQAVLRAEERRDGKHTAKHIDSIWKDLTNDEKSIIEYLVLSAHSTFIAKFEDDTFSSLTSKGLLQIPPGVGTLFMQKMETAYRVPVAVWAVLSKEHTRFFSHPSSPISKHLADLKKGIGSRIDKLI